MATLELTTMVGCPVKCTFCPQDTLKAAYGKSTKYLSYDFYRLMLAKVPKHVRIDFSGMAEPWANPDCTKMLEHTLAKGYRVAIYTTLYGMTAEIAASVVTLLEQHRAQVEAVCIHVQDKNNNMRGLKFNEPWVASFNVFVDAIRANKLPSASIMTMDKDGEIHPFLEKTGIRPPGFFAIDRAGSLDKDALNGQPVHETDNQGKRISCASTPYYDHNVLMPNGDVLLCCMDYGYKHVIGNLMHEGYYGLFRSDEMADVVESNMQPNPDKCSICRICYNVTEIH
jgi:organic radical activating enzyme